MTSPITKQKKGAKPVAPEPALRTWCCGSSIKEPHVEGCAYEPREDNPVDYTGPVEVIEPAQEPPPSPTEVPAAAPRVYGIKKAGVHDLELTDGSWVQYKKLKPGHLLKLNLVEVMDGLTPELLADIQGEDQAVAESAALKALADPTGNAKIFGPIDRVIVAALVNPPAVLDAPATGNQVHVDDIDLEDKVMIFHAAVGEQLAALKSIRD